MIEKFDEFVPFDLEQNLSSLGTRGSSTDEPYRRHTPEGKVVFYYSIANCVAIELSRLCGRTPLNLSHFICKVGSQEAVRETVSGPNFKLWREA
jgi:hypothetical protein